MTKTDVYITAGEASGDALGARLMQAIRQDSVQAPEFYGVGGPLMEAEGLKSLFPMNDLSVMGLVEVVPKLRKIIKRINQTVDRIEKINPDVLITIDSPDFSFRVTERVRKRGMTSLKAVHYNAPTVWAWRPERAAHVANLYDGLMCLYPFEPPYFSGRPVNAQFVGHPVLEAGYLDANGKKIREECGIADSETVFGVFFGSRLGELNRTGPVLRDMLLKTLKGRAGTHVMTLTLPHLKKSVKNMLEGMPSPVHIYTDDSRKAEIFASLDAAAAVSGTIGLELAVADVPHLIAYKMNPLTWQMIRRKLTTEHAHLANILLKKRVVPEFIQQKCKIRDMAIECEALLDNESCAAAQREAFARVRESLAPGDSRTPSAAAASFIRKIF